MYVKNKAHKDALLEYVSITHPQTLRPPKFASEETLSDFCVQILPRKDNNNF